MKNRLCSLLLIVLFAVPVAWAVTPEGPPTWNPPAERIVAIGDLHGDLDATRRAFILAGAIDDLDNWIGGKLVVVQTGDQLDRGDNEQEILELLEKLVPEAAAAGGALHILNGNHEVMNVRCDLRYITPGGFADFDDAVTVPEEPDSLLLAHDKSQWARITAFRPGGPYAMMMAKRNSIVIVGDNIFVHGGVLPAQVKYGIEKLNQDIRAWMAGDGPVPEGTHSSKGSFWTRLYSDEVGWRDCRKLSGVLEDLNVKRMIVGHTIQEDGITSFCDNKVWCIDVGMAEHYGGEPAVLEIIGDNVRVLQ